MSVLALAQRDQVLSIYRESHALWGGGLSPDGYLALWDELSRTPWARKNTRFLVWTDSGGNVLSSLKLYRPRVRVGQRTGRASVLGAIFTPRQRRRRGHATRLVQAVLERSRSRGDLLALLFSDIGTDYYRAFGFRPLPADEYWGPLPRRVATPPAGWTIRPAGQSDQEAVRRAHEQSSRDRVVAVVRDDEHWDFLEARTRGYFSRLSVPELDSRLWVAHGHDGRSGYLYTVEGRGEWSVREVGSNDGEPRTMACVLRAGAAMALSIRLRRVYGWFPADLAAEIGDLRLRQAPRRRAIPMVLPLSAPVDPACLASPVHAHVPFQDQF